MYIGLKVRLFRFHQAFRFKMKFQILHITYNNEMNINNRRKLLFFLQKYCLGIDFQRFD